MVDEFAGRTLGGAIRALREAREVTLREMARRLNVTPTYLSQVEQGRFSPPTEDRINQIGQILGLSQGQIDELVALAGRVSQDLHDAVREHPREMATFLRTARGLTAGDIEALTEEAQRLKGQGR